MNKLLMSTFLVSALLIVACGLNNESHNKEDLKQELKILRCQGLGEKHTDILRVKRLING